MCQQLPTVHEYDYWLLDIGVACDEEIPDVLRSQGFYFFENPKLTILDRGSLQRCPCSSILTGFTCFSNTIVGTSYLRAKVNPIFGKEKT